MKEDGRMTARPRSALGRPLERGPCAYFYANLPLCVPSVRADFGCERTKDVATKREHPHTQRQFELYILDHYIVNLVCMVLALL